MMSLHRSTHSSQMYTDGPAISLRTSCSLLLQNEQYNVRWELLLPLLLSSAMSDLVKLVPESYQACNRAFMRLVSVIIRTGPPWPHDCSEHHRSRRIPSLPVRS